MTSERVSDERLQYLIEISQHRREYLSIFTELQSLRSAREAEPVAFPPMLAALQAWRDEDHADTIGLSRDQVINLIEEIRPRLLPSPSTEGLGVKVKGLEWVDITVSKPMHAVTEIGTYYINKRNFGSCHWRLEGHGPAQEVMGVEAAKAAAQADYERRILSALDLSPAEGEPRKADYFAVQSASGNHVGMWTEVQIAAKVFQDEHPGGTLIPLYTAPPNPVVSDEMVERARHAHANNLDNGGHFTSAMQAALTAAISVKPQSGSDKP